MFTKLWFIAVLDFVKIVFVELAYKRSKVGVFEETGEDGFCEFVHVLECVRLIWLRCGDEYMVNVPLRRNNRLEGPMRL